MGCLRFGRLLRHAPAPRTKRQDLRYLRLAKSVQRVSVATARAADRVHDAAHGRAQAERHSRRRENV